MHVHSVDEDEIEIRVSALRSRLVNALPSTPNAALFGSTNKASIRALKSHDSHALAAAKQDEMSKMGRAMGISAGHVEGKAFSRREAEMERAERAEKREQLDKERAEAIAAKERVSRPHPFHL